MLYILFHSKYLIYQQYFSYLPLFLNVSKISKYPYSDFETVHLLIIISICKRSDLSAHEILIHLQTTSASNLNYSEQNGLAPNCSILKTLELKYKQIVFNAAQGCSRSQGSSE
ncbi:unnamed protein product [Paramecium primaurelia]|uniref:Uncharacterized protein n=1 Tax=Paramecium primaurelia TaxID=5886 RepID=A0A8S1Q0Q0_PARPR|nr:unnamed protein product [Paramecium primaurelia]